MSDETFKRGQESDDLAIKSINYETDPKVSFFCAESTIAKVLDIEASGNSVPTIKCILSF